MRTDSVGHIPGELESNRGAVAQERRRHDRRRVVGAASHTSTPRAPTGPVWRSRPSASGKFLFVGEEKLYVQGVTYGTFRPNEREELYPSSTIVAHDFATMARNGFNAVRTYTLPPRWLLDIAAEHGLFVLVGIAWEQHVDFLERRRRAQAIEDRIRAGVGACAGHPAVLGYAVGNEIPSHIVRWLGKRRVERYVARLYRAAKSEDPEALVTYVNYPPTEYLQLPFLDFTCFNVYLESSTAFESYLARLQNISGDLPLVMAELGLDSRRHGEHRQAHVLDWQIRAVLASGCAGAFVFSWTDDWYVSYLSEVETGEGGEAIDDWDFGLTSRDRRPKPALSSARAAFEDGPFPSHRPWPRVSVVVCTFNGARTLRACLEGLSRLLYPDFEVIVVNDGSTDSSLAIACEYDVRVISGENRGLATARNLGLEAATGEIVAYLDDDAHPDRDWLRYLVAAFERGEYGAVGGPNVPPTALPLDASCFGDAPGTPVHVLVSDRTAEHIPGCNMAFRKRALEEVSGFDTSFRIAGDDVDVCWRLLDAGYSLGFSPPAFVWHRPRTSIRAYWRQQREYGKAEATLERRWPDKYARGHARWAGQIYARGPRAALGRARVRYGTWGSALFQSLYSPGGSALSSLLGAPEWHMWIATLALVSLAGAEWTPLLLALPLFAAALGVTLLAAAAGAAQARSVLQPTSRRVRVRRRALTTFLHLIQPLARTRGRLAGHAVHARSRAGRFAVPWPRTLTDWTDAWQPSEHRLSEIEDRLRTDGAVVSRGGVYDRWDLQVRYGFAAAVRISLGIEEHGAGRQLVRLRLMPRHSRGVLCLMGALAAVALVSLAAGAHLAAITLLAAAAVLAARAASSTARAMGGVLEHVTAALQRNPAVLREPADVDLPV